MEFYNDTSFRLRIHIAVMESFKLQVPGFLLSFPMCHHFWESHRTLNLLRETMFLLCSLGTEQWLSSSFKLIFKDIITDSLRGPDRKQVIRTQKPWLEPAALTDSLTTAEAIGFPVKDEDSPQLPCLLHHQRLCWAWPCTRDVPLPSPSPQRISIWSTHHAGEGASSPCAGNH